MSNLLRSGLLFFCLASASLAQTDTGSLSGQVTDPSGGAVPGAMITLKNKATSSERRTVSGTEGRYQFNLLAPGLYELAV